MRALARFALRLSHAARGRAGAWPLAALLLGLAAAPAWSQVERLDDSASPRAQVQARTAGDGIIRPGTTVSPIVQVSFGRIEYRLNMARHVGKRARIYYVIPPAVPGVRTPNAIVVQWTAQGLFAPGQARPGQRVPVWSGVVRDPWIHEALDLNWQVDTRELRLARGMPLGFEAYFEIETLP